MDARTVRIPRYACSAIAMIRPYVGLAIGGTSPSAESLRCAHADEAHESSANPISFDFAALPRQQRGNPNPQSLRRIFKLLQDDLLIGKQLSSKSEIHPVSLAHPTLRKLVQTTTRNCSPRQASQSLHVVALHVNVVVGELCPSLFHKLSTLLQDSICCCEASKRNPLLHSYLQRQPLCSRILRSHH